MTRLLRFVAAALVLVALFGADGGCTRKGDVESDRPPGSRGADPATKRTVYIRAFSDQPYTVLVIAQELGPGNVPKGGIDRTGPEAIPGGIYRQQLDYTSGLRVNIKVTVYGHADDRFSCSIEDGSFNRDRQGPAAREVTCILTTVR